MGQALYILLGFAATVAITFGIGQMILARFKVELFRQERPAIAIVLGSAVWSFFVFLLAAAHLIHKGVLIAIAAAILYFAWKKKYFRLSGESFPPLPKPWKYALGLIGVVFGLLYVTNAMAPEISPDGVSYHLGLTARYYREHGFRPNLTNMYANLSQAMEMLFLLPFAIGRHSAAAMMHMTFLWLLPWLILCYGRRTGAINAGALAAILIFCSPVIGIDGISAYNDVATATSIFTVFYLVQLWKRQQQDSLLICIGLAAGFAYALKYTAFLALPYALSVIIRELRRDKKPWLAPVLGVSAIASVLILPWMIKNILNVGNPVSPFLNSIFPNHYIHIWFEKSYKLNMATYGSNEFWRIPMEVTFGGQRLGGLLGPIFLLLPLGMLGFRKPAARPLILAALLFTLPYPANLGTRFLIPAAPFWALSFGLLIETVPYLPLTLALLHAVLSWPDSIPLYSEKYVWSLHRIPWHHALRIKSEDDYLGRHIGPYAIAREIDKIIPADSTIFAFDQNAEAYFKPKLAVGFQSAYGERIIDIFHSVQVPAYQPTGRTTFSFPAQRLKRLRITQTANLPNEKWSMAEFRVFSKGRELPRSAEWRLSASPNHWDVAMAFDNSPATRWSSWEGKRPGMFIEVEFPELQLVDKVVLEVSRDQTPGFMTLEGWDQYGNKYQLSNSPKESVIDPPEGWRMMATRAMMDRGVDYFLITNTNHGYMDVLKNAKYWGMELVTVKGYYRLYKLTGKPIEDPKK